MSETTSYLLYILVIKYQKAIVYRRVLQTNFILFYNLDYMDFMARIVIYFYDISNNLSKLYY